MNIPPTSSGNKPPTHTVFEYLSALRRRADALAGVRGAAVEAFGADNPILAPLMGGGDGE